MMESESSLNQLITEAQFCSEMKDYEKMLTITERICVQFPHSTRGPFLKATALTFLGLHSEAMEYLQPLIHSDIDADLVFYWLAVNHHNLRDLQAADNAIDRALQANPLNLSCWLKKGWIAYDLEHFDSVRLCVKRVLDCDSENVEALVLLSLTFDGDHPEEVKEKSRIWETLVNLEPDNAEFHNDLGVTYLQMRQYRKAQDCFKQAARIDPEMKEYWDNFFLALRYNSIVFRVLQFPLVYISEISKKHAQGWGIAFVVIPILVNRIFNNDRSLWGSIKFILCCLGWPLLVGILVWGGLLVLYIKITKQTVKIEKDEDDKDDKDDKEERPRRIRVWAFKKDGLLIWFLMTLGTVSLILLVYWGSHSDMFKLVFTGLLVTGGILYSLVEDFKQSRSAKAREKTERFIDDLSDKSDGVIGSVTKEEKENFFWSWSSKDGKRMSFLLFIWVITIFVFFPVSHFIETDFDQAVHLSFKYLMIPVFAFFYLYMFFFVANWSRRRPFLFYLLVTPVLAMMFCIMSASYIILGNVVLGSRTKEVVTGTVISVKPIDKQSSDTVTSVRMDKDQKILKLELPLEETRTLKRGYPFSREMTRGAFGIPYRMKK